MRRGSATRWALGAAGVAALALGAALLFNGFTPWSFLAAFRSYAALHPWLAMPAFGFAYAVFVAACLPTGPAMGMAAGALFGAWHGTACALAGAVSGATAQFLFARFALRPAPAGRYAALLDRIRPQLERDGFPALLALRVAPVVPSWLLNGGAALAGMRLRPFLLATVLGLLPATAVFAHAGAGLGLALDGAGAVLRPAVLLPLLALSVLVLLPAILRFLRSRSPS